MLNGDTGRAWMWSLLLLAVTGCGKSDWGHLEGTVKLSGQPVGPGTIQFQPVNPQQAGATASFGEDGKYCVFSSGKKEGAHTGEYNVLISGGEDFGLEESGPKPKSKIPPRYSNPGTSDLKVTIERGKKTVDFDLKP